jgi:hypothetical protein
MCQTGENTMMTVTVGNKKYSGKILGYDPETKDIHIELSGGMELIRREGRTVVVPSSEAGKYKEPDCNVDELFPPLLSRGQ